MGLLDKISQPLSGLIGGGLNLISQGVQNRFQQQQTELQNRKNLELANYQYQQQKEMFNLSNAYNSPTAQMQRFKDAGLNPNLIYGQGSPGNAPNVLPQYKAPMVEANIRQPVNVSDAVGRAIDTAVRSEQLNILSAERRGKELDNLKKSSEEPYFSEMAEAKFGSTFADWQRKALEGIMNSTLSNIYFSQGEQIGRHKYRMNPTDLGIEAIKDWSVNKYNMPISIAKSKLASVEANIALMNANKDLANRRREVIISPYWNLGLQAIKGLSDFIPSKRVTNIFRSFGSNNKKLTVSNPSLNDYYRTLRNKGGF